MLNSLTQVLSLNSPRSLNGALSVAKAPITEVIGMPPSSLMSSGILEAMKTHRAQGVSPLTLRERADGVGDFIPSSIVLHQETSRE